MSLQWFYLNKPLMDEAQFSRNVHGVIQKLFDFLRCRPTGQFNNLTEPEKRISASVTSFNENVTSALTSRVQCSRSIFIARVHCKKYIEDKNVRISMKCKQATKNGLMNGFYATLHLSMELTAKYFLEGAALKRFAKELHEK